MNGLCSKRLAVLCLAMCAVTNIANADTAGYDEIGQALKVSIGSPGTIEYRYVAREAAGTVEGLVSRRGDQFYGASVSKSNGGGISMPSECAWDGTTAYLRVGMGLFSQKKEREFAKSGYPTPESAIHHDLKMAYQLNGSGDASYQYKRTVDGGKNVVIAEFDFKERPKALLRIWHRLDRGCLPERILLSIGDVPVTDISVLDYVPLRSVEGETFLPAIVEVWTQLEAPGSERKLLRRFEIDKDSILVDEKVTRTYRLEPWPNEVVSNMDAGTARAPKDPQWIPDERVGFPFKEFTQAVIARQQKTNAVQDSDLSTTIAEKVRAQSDAAPAPDSFARWTLALMTAAFMIAGLALFLRGRMARTARR